MNNHKIYCINASAHFTSVSLISAYDSHIYGEHHNPFVSNNEQYEMHCMLFTLDGSAHIALKDGSVIDISQNNVFFGQNSAIDYMESNCEHWHQLAYWFAVQNIKLPLNRVFPIKNIDQKKEIRYMDRVIFLMQTQQENNINYANALCAKKLFEVLGTVNYFQSKQNEKLDEIISYINANIESPLTLKDVASAFHYCEKHLNHIFRTSMNIAPKKFINDTKLDNVCFLLSTTSLSIQELAEKYSYASASHLTNAFKKAAEENETYKDKAAEWEQKLKEICENPAFPAQNAQYGEYFQNSVR